MARLDDAGRTAGPGRGAASGPGISGLGAVPARDRPALRHALAELASTGHPIGAVAPLPQRARSRSYLASESSEARWSSGARWAIKIVPPPGVATAQAVAAVLAGYPGALPLSGAGVVRRSGYLIRPWLPGDLAGTLADRSAPVAPESLGAVLAPVADALHRLHAAGYLHADVKPGNVLLDEAGRGVLADLDECLPVAAVATRGTPGFAAPELVAGHPVGPAADSYGFGALVAVALLGTHDAASARQWLAARVPPTLARLVRAALDPDPDRRPAPGEIVAALRAQRAPTPWPPDERGPADPKPELSQRKPDDPTEPGSGGGSATLSPRALARHPPDPVDDGRSADGESSAALDALLRAAEAAFGRVDLTAPTVDRPALQTEPAPVPALAPEPSRRRMSRPRLALIALICLLAAAAALITVLALIR